jgi:hypothetical protein
MQKFMITAGIAPTPPSILQAVTSCIFYGQSCNSEILILHRVSYAELMPHIVSYTEGKNSVLFFIMGIYQLFTMQIRVQ